jgi:integrase
MEVGVDIKTLSELLGHASVDITLNTYVHSSLERKRSEIEKLSSLCG